MSEKDVIDDLLHHISNKFVILDFKMLQKFKNLKDKDLLIIKSSLSNLKQSLIDIKNFYKIHNNGENDE